MTVNQIINFGIKTNSWISSGFNAILFNGDQKLYASPKAVQYYFDSENELLFARYTDSLSIPESKLFTTSEYYEYNNNKYTFLDGGINDKIIGRYHAVYDINSITSIY